MRKLTIVTYDVRDDRRLRTVFKVMRGFGDHLQYSVFRCELTAADRERMITALSEVLHFGEDQVLMFDLGPSDGLKANQIAHIGQPYVPSDHDALVV